MTRSRPLLSALLLAATAASGCGRDVDRPLQPARGDADGQVAVHMPDRLHGLDVDGTLPDGTVARVRCATCHDGRPVDADATADGMTSFHTGMRFSHGALSCGSCHAPDARDALRLADGAEVPMTEALALCAQCHGPQTRDYRHGSHGGAAGAWDLSRGNRSRNHCLDCHDAHAPAYPRFLPVHPPIDRNPLRHAHDGHGRGAESHD